MITIARVCSRFFVPGFLALIFLFISVSSDARPARADAAPALEETNVIGSILSPYKFIQTRVQMVDELVRLKVEPVPAQELLLSRLIVEADFHMRNTGVIAETMRAVFPITDLRCPWVAGPGDWTIREHEVDEDSFTVSLDGQSAPTQEITTTTVVSSVAPGLLLDCTTKWKSFEVTFLPKQDLRIKVGYVLSPGSELAYSWDSFTYILKTGKAWYGSIGRVDISMQLPYSIERDNVLQASPGYQIHENNLTWRWVNLEPESNFNVVVLSPQTHRDLEAVRARLEAHPEDPGAWASLGQIDEQLSRRHDYPAICASAVTREDYVFSTIKNWAYARQAEQAYREAIRLSPDSAEYQTNLAVLLASMSLSGNGGQIWAGFPSVQKTLQSFNRALALGNTGVASYASQSFRNCILGPDDAYPKCACGY